jgi:SAM-dependent methyltransferase
MKIDKLTDIEFWDDYWQKYQLPLEMKKSNHNLYLNEILKTFDRHFPGNENLTVLEIGGSPGQYLAYLHRTHGYYVNCLDYSPIGCQKTKENFALLDIKGEVYEADLFLENSNIPKFDIVYSLGLIEHFSDLNLIIEKHLNFLKPGGILVIGAPNFLGINHFFLKRLAPEHLAKHNLKNMDLDTWSHFEQKFNLETIYKGYVGGFHPSIFNRRETKTLSSLLLLITAKFLVFTFKKHFKRLRQYNSKYFSGYVIGFYLKGNSK